MRLRRCLVHRHACVCAISTHPYSGSVPCGCFPCFWWTLYTGVWRAHSHVLATPVMLGFCSGDARVGALRCWHKCSERVGTTVKPRSVFSWFPGVGLTVFCAGRSLCFWRGMVPVRIRVWVRVAWCLVCLGQCLWCLCVAWLRGAGGHWGHRLGSALFQVFGLRALTMPVVMCGLASCVCVSVSHVSVYTHTHVHVHAHSAHACSGSVPCERFCAFVAVVRHISQRSNFPRVVGWGVWWLVFSDGRIFVFSLFAFPNQGHVEFYQATYLWCHMCSCTQAIFKGAFVASQCKGRHCSRGVLA